MTDGELELKLENILRNINKVPFCDRDQLILSTQNHNRPYSYLFDPFTGEARIIGNDIYVAGWMADGNSLYGTVNLRREGILHIELDGSFHRIFELNEFLNDMTISPDGKNLLFDVNDYGSKATLYSLRLGKNPSLSKIANDIYSSSSGGRDYSYSPKGRLIAFLSEMEEWHIGLVGTSSLLKSSRIIKDYRKTIETIDHRGISCHRGSDFNITSVEFIDEETLIVTNNYEIALLPLDNDIISLTNIAKGETFAVSPNKKYLAFVEGERYHNNNLLIMDIESRESIIVKEKIGHSTLSWSPDSKYMSYSLDGEIKLFDINSKKGVELPKTYCSYKHFDGLRPSNIIWRPLRNANP